MGNFPNCGAEMGIGIAICPNCGGDLGGEASDITETRTFDLVVETEVLGGGGTITVGISPRKDDGDTHVHTINYEQTI